MISMGYKKLSMPFLFQLAYHKKHKKNAFRFCVECAFKAGIRQMKGVMFRGVGSPDASIDKLSRLLAKHVCNMQPTLIPRPAFGAPCPPSPLETPIPSVEELESPVLHVGCLLKVSAITGGDQHRHPFLFAWGGGFL